MRRGGGKAKGAAFERWCCKILSLWMSHGKRQDLYWRSSMSGGRSTVARKKGVDVQQFGDICSVHPDGHVLTNHFYFECKFVKSMDFGPGLINRTGKFVKFWHTTCHEARKHDRVPVLIIRQNGWPTLLCTNHGGASSLQMRPDNTLVTSPKYGFHVGYFEDVLEHAMPGAWAPRKVERVRRSPGPTMKELRENW